MNATTETIQTHEDGIKTGIFRKVGKKWCVFVENGKVGETAKIRKKSGETKEVRLTGEIEAFTFDFVEMTAAMRNVKKAEADGEKTGYFKKINGEWRAIVANASAADRVKIMKKNGTSTMVILTYRDDSAEADAYGFTESTGRIRSSFRRRALHDDMWGDCDCEICTGEA